MTEHLTGHKERPGRNNMKKLKFILPLILILALIFSANCFAYWDVSIAVYANKSKLVSAQDNNPYGVALSSDGSKMYMIGNASNTVYQYTLSTPWDMSTAEYAEKSKGVGLQDGTPLGVAFSPDGSKMYMAGNDSDRVYQYTLSTPWDVDTAIYANKYKSVGAQDLTPYGVVFSSDGSKMYIVGNENDTVYQYTLSTPWDVDTANYAAKSKGVGGQETVPYDAAFSSDGSKMYIVGTVADTVYQYTLSTPWDVSTATYANKYKSVGAQEGLPSGVDFSPDGSKMYIVGNSNKTVYQYTLPLNPPTNVDATDGTHTDKVVITWAKSDGATGYQVYRNATPLGWLGDVATYNDTGADAPTITVGTASASDGTSPDYVTLSIAGESVTNGTTHTYKVKAKNVAGESGYSGTNTGYRGHGTLTYQWQRSAADSNENYSNIDGATTDPYNDTGAPENGDGRYFKCVENATGAAEQTTNADRGHRIPPVAEVNVLFFSRINKKKLPGYLNPGSFRRYLNEEMLISVAEVSLSFLLGHAVFKHAPYRGFSSNSGMNFLTIARVNAFSILLFPTLSN
ncbi:hypothetical protein ES705_16705 [subsurface metagenome]